LISINNELVFKNNLLSHVLNYLKSILTFFKVQSCTIVSFTCASFVKSMGYHERVVPLADWTSKANGSIKFGQVATLGAS
jgi:hypothetical protein